VVDPDGKGYAVVGRGSILWVFSVFIQCGENDAQAVFCRVQYVVLSASLYSKAFLHLWYCGYICAYIYIYIYIYISVYIYVHVRISLLYPVRVFSFLCQNCTCVCLFPFVCRVKTVGVI
jgi:hypothetical protein